MCIYSVQCSTVDSLVYNVEMPVALIFRGPEMEGPSGCVCTWKSEQKIQRSCYTCPKDQYTDMLSGLTQPDGLLGTIVPMVLNALCLHKMNGLLLILF